MLPPANLSAGGIYFLPCTTSAHTLHTHVLSIRFGYTDDLTLLVIGEDD
jgi:hypothetical protein